MLGQLVCQGCGDRFWPDDHGAPVLACPRCGAGHANPDAVPLPVWKLPLTAPATHAVRGWAARHWLDELPRVGLSGPLAAQTSASGAHDGFRYLACSGHLLTYTSGRRLGQDGTWTYVFVAAQPPAVGGEGSIGRWRPARGGVWTYTARRVGAPELERDLLPEITGALRAAGHAPLHPWVEAEAPTPLPREDVALVLRGGPAPGHALESLDLTCDGCGAAVQVTGLVGRRCVYCGAPQALDPAVEAALRGYRLRVHAAQLGGAPSLMNAAWRGRASGEGMSLACVVCGAPNAHAPGATDERCGACGAALLPSSAARARTLEAQDGPRRAALAVAAYREAAQAYLLEGAGGGLLVCLAACGLLGGAMMGASVVFRLARGHHGSPPLAIVILGALWLLGLLGVFVVSVRGRRRASRWRSRVALLAEQLGGELGHGARTLDAWARRWWADRLASSWLRDAPGRGVVSAQIAGFPVALCVAPEDPWGTRAHVAVLVACALPRDVVYWIDHGAAAALGGELAELGFEVRLRTGGVVVEARPRLRAAIAADPQRLSLLGPVAHAAARLAHLLRAEPPREVPPPLDSTTGRVRGT